MAFYQFLAIFPALFVFLAITARVPQFGDHVNSTLRDLTGQVLPDQVSQLLRQIMDELNGHALSGAAFIFAAAGAFWAALNSTWAMIYGLNRAYEVEEQRSWRKMMLTIVALTVFMAATSCIAIFLTIGGSYLEAHLHARVAALRTLEWLVLVVSVSLFFAVLYRFAPNVPEHEWRWSTPGAACALVIWITAIFAARFYFNYVNDYSRAYGYLNGVAIFLLWLYISNGAILIGGEMNSEIEKAASEPRLAKS